MQTGIHANFFLVFTMPWFWCAFLGWTIAQFIKMIISLRKTHTIDFTYFVSTGGMPSAHSAMVVGLAVGVGLTEGFDSALAMASMAFASVTMFDAATVRRAAGLQARVLNKMMHQIFKEHRLTVKPLRELLGHTRTEVFGGLVTGTIAAIIVINLFVYMGWYTI